MVSKTVKRPVYDGNVCLLYDFMVAQALTEEDVAKRMGLDKERKACWGEEVYDYAPWYPISQWFMEPNSIPIYYMPRLCRVLNAPIEACFQRSKILNGQKFQMSFNHIAHEERRIILTDISSEEMIQELKKRGYRIFKEV